jgi:CBS domain containing-hemolysin-like protein
VTLEVLIFILIFIFGVVLSALCSGLEIGTYTINRVRLAVRSGRGRRRALRLKHELDHPERLLITLLVINNIANYLGSLGIAGVLKTTGVGPWIAIVINSVILVPILFIFAETLPKDLFRTFTDHWTYHFAWFIRYGRIVLTWVGVLPLIRGVVLVFTRMLGDNAARTRSARQRVLSLMQEGAGSGVLSPVQVDLVDRALLLRECPVRSEMIRWREVRTIPLLADQASRERILRACDFARLPVVERGGRVAGIMHAMDAAVHPERSTHELIRPAVFVEPETPALEALRLMRAERAQLAIVQVPGTTSPIGVVAIKDLVEPLIGEVHDW